MSSIPLTVIAVTILSSFSARCEDELPNVISNCFKRDDYTVRCASDFNASNFLFEERQQVDPVFYWLEPSLKYLEIFNSDVEEIDESLIQFHGFKFETIFIENATKLRSISPNTLVELKYSLTDFRAINTGLPQYNDFGNGPHEKENPFDDFHQLRAVFIGKQSRCPSDETLLYPCTCEFGLQSRSPTGLSGSSTNYFGTTEVICTKDMTGDELKEVFRNVSQSDHERKNFDVFTIRGAKSLSNIPSNVFSNVSITTIWMADLDNLKSIHPKAFVSDTNDDRTGRPIQMLDTTTANFTAASFTVVDDLFYALSTLINIRILRLTMCGIPHIPSHAFTPKDPQKQLNNLHYLSLSEDRTLHKSGIKSVGSYAFSGAPKLVELGIDRNFIEEFNSFAFAFNETSNSPLTIFVGGNPFNDSYGLKPNAFSGSQRPLGIEFFRFGSPDGGIELTLDFIPENVFRPFIDENSGNYFAIDAFNVDVWCDCNSKWMFDGVGNLKGSIKNGLRVKTGLETLSIQCKPDSSFECLPSCLSFPLNGLIHCGGNRQFDVKSTFLQLGQSSGTKRFDKLLFSSKEIQQLPFSAFGDFQFEDIRLEGCWNLFSIHTNAFGASTETVKLFTAKNSNLTLLPNFASFPNLVEIRLDDYRTINLNSSNLDFSDMTIGSSIHPKEISIFVSGGTIGPKTFIKLNNATAVNLIIGEGKGCSMFECIMKCKPNKFLIDEETVKTFLAANPENKIQTICPLECSCGLKWMCKNWKDIGSRIGVWGQEYHEGAFHCVPRKGEDYPRQTGFQFKYGKYFQKNCCSQKLI